MKVKKDEFEKLLLDPSKDNCRVALKVLGTMHHMWQDYYAHGVEKDDDSGASVGLIKGNPENPQMVPVSFGKIGFTGGHGGFFRVMNPLSRVEPGDRAEDKNERRRQAKFYTKEKSISHLDKWFKKCKCFYYNKEIINN